MKKAGIFTIVLIVLAAVVILYAKSGQTRSEEEPAVKGTLVKERVEWKRYYM